MKQFKTIYTTITLSLLTLIGTPTAAQPADSLATDSIEVTLVTCSPHEEIYSLYGHSALRYHDLRTGEDAVFNWGIFNFKKPHFVTRFVFGLTDYELGVGDFGPFCNYYRRWGSSVTEQVLDLTPQEKLKLRAALAENLRPENRVYRYNYFYDNCSTRPRDIIERCLNGRVLYDDRQDYTPSFREMIHQCGDHHAWAMFGNDMLLGLKADLKTSRTEQEFLPQNLLYDFDHARIHASDGSYRPLVKERRIAVMPGVQVREADFPLTPLQCALGLLALSLLIAALEWKRHKTFKFWDAVLMLLTGLAGCVLFIMLFSQHPCTTLNLQLLLFNPLPLCFIYSVVRGRPTRWWHIQAVLIGLFLLGALVQDYAEGMEILALCLLIRSMIHIKYAK